MANPYNDERMIYEDGRYILTEAALVENGTDLRSRLQNNLRPELVINRLLRHISAMIYNFIHSYSTENEMQDALIATVPALRPIIFAALLNQAEYVLMNGDLTRSVDRDKRAIAIDENARLALDTTVPELGCSILWAGCR